MKMSVEQQSVHEVAIQLAKQHQSVEAELIVVLQKVERLKIHRLLGLQSLFQYATEVLKLDDAIAYALISVSRKSLSVPELKSAIEHKMVSVFKANRIVSILNNENAKELIEFASGHSKRDIEREVARRDPKANTPDKITVMSPEWSALKASVSTETLKLLERVESLLAQKGSNTAWDDVLKESANAYLDKHDPVRKAERAQKRKTLCPGRVNLVGSSNGNQEQRTNERETSTGQTNRITARFKRISLTAEQKNAVFLRDKGRCTHVGKGGQRCNQDRWVDVHHIVRVKDGGTNEPGNLTTLCWSHHDLVHQMEFPIDGAVTWLRSPTMAYG